MDAGASAPFQDLHSLIKPADTRQPALVGKVCCSRHLRSHRSGGKLECACLVRCQCGDWRLCLGAEIAIDCVHVRQKQKGIGSELLCEKRAGGAAA